MYYMGGKSRQAKHFAPSLEEALVAGNGCLVEPFVGAFNMVYADPPYANSTQYKQTGFIREQFDGWCREQKRAGARVFTSEYVVGAGWEVKVDLSCPVTMDSKAGHQARHEYLLELA